MKCWKWVTSESRQCEQASRTQSSFQISKLSRPVELYCISSICCKYFIRDCRRPYFRKHIRKSVTWLGFFKEFLISLIFLGSNMLLYKALYAFFYKYAWHNNLLCPMIGEVSLETVSRLTHDVKLIISISFKEIKLCV